MKKGYRYFLMMSVVYAAVNAQATTPGTTYKDATDITMSKTYPMIVGACVSTAPIEQPYRPNDTNKCPTYEIFVGIRYDQQNHPIKILCASADQCIGPGPDSVDIDPPPPF